MIDHKIVITVTAHTGSGKSTVARLIADAIQAACLGEVEVIDPDDEHSSLSAEEKAGRQMLRIKNLHNKLKVRLTIGQVARSCTFWEGNSIK